MALIIPQQADILGTGITTGEVAASVSDTIEPDGRTFLLVRNVSAATRTVTIVVPGTLYGQARPDVAMTVTNNQTKIIGSLVRDLADPATGLITVTLDAAPNVFYTAFRV